MHKPFLGLLLSLLLSGFALLRADSPASAPTKKAVVWNIDNLEAIGGHQVTVVGKPRVIETDRGKAVEFDGKGDGLFVAANPLAGLKEFAVEVIFRPAAGGPKEQRFLHFQPNGSEDRVLFETRLTPEGRWFLDTYLQAGKEKQTLYAEKFLHPLGAWHQAAIVVDGKTMRHYVNGKEELAADVPFAPLDAGQTSIGVRFNRVFWYQGAIRQIRVTPAVLKPDGFLTLSAAGRAEEPRPPKGFRAIFNGKDLAGWYGLNPHSVGKLTGEKKKANLAQQRAEFAKYWKVENGELVNDGNGPYATTEEEFGDIELLIDYKTVAKADSGIYLRGTPQVQIWDWNQVFNPKNPTRKPHLGSGGLFNNTPGKAGRDPLVLADRAFGEWNQFRIRQVGDVTWVWLNDKLVVEGAVMENFWDRKMPLPARGPIMLQTHGGEIRWRNIFVRDIGAGEAKHILGAAKPGAKAEPNGASSASLSKALTLHASFDEGLDADFARGDKTCYNPKGKDLEKATPTAEVKLAPKAGRFGGALHFTKKNNFRPSFKDAGVLGYNAKSWSATVSVWLRLSPDEDLEPGYCDPVQIIGDESKKGYIFMEWSKDEKPRYFRYAIRPLFPIWNPNNLQWHEIPFEKKPMVQVAKAPFARDTWTHAVFTLDNINDKSKPQTGRLYLNGKLQGTIEKWDLTFAWDPARVLLVLGAAYVGHMDDLAVFNRSLTEGEVMQLHGLKEGVRELR